MKFLQDITLGQYLPGDSLLHRLDPRTKFISLLLLMILAFSSRTLAGLAALGGFTCLVLLLARLPWAFVFRGVRPFAWVLAATAVLHFFLTPGPPLPSPLGVLPITWTGLEKGILIALQLFLALFLSSLMTLTTSPLKLAHGLEKLLMPLRRLRVPVEDFSMMIMLAIRFIPLLLGEMERILKAQSARGVDFETGGFFRRARNLVPLLVPLFHSVFKRADDLAVAMLARGYVSGARRTHLHELRADFRDYLALAVVAALFFLEMIF